MAKAPEHSDFIKIAKDNPDDWRDYEPLLFGDLKVVIAACDPNKKAPAGRRPDDVLCWLAVPAGHSDTPPEFPGLPHLVEHLFSRGSTERSPESKYTSIEVYITETKIYLMRTYSH